jgi:steroid delta-isomerase-like uncharacterized protein
MSAEANKALVRRFYDEVWVKGNLDAADEVFAPDYVRHDLRATQATAGPEGQKRIAADFRTAFPDLSFDVEFVLAEDDLVAGRWTARGTHLGAWAGQPPTGRPMRFSAVNVFRFDGGKVVELWNHRDDLGLMEQLGAPVHGGAAPE